MTDHDRTSTPYDALLADRDRSAPLVTWYDDASGARVELSAASLLNGISKCAGALRDEFGVQPGDVVSLHLPMHWQRATWLGACWFARAVAAPDHLGECAVAVVPTGFDCAVDADELLEVDLSPLWLPARQHPDVFTPVSRQRVDDPAVLLSDSTVLDAAEVLSVAQVLADAWRVGPGGRLMAIDPVPDSATGLANAAGWFAALPVPLATDGSVVLVANEERERRAERLRSERVTAIATGP